MSKKQLRSCSEFIGLQLKIDQNETLLDLMMGGILVTMNICQFFRQELHLLAVVSASRKLNLSIICKTIRSKLTAQKNLSSLYLKALYASQRNTLNA